MPKCLLLLLLLFRAGTAQQTRRDQDQTPPKKPITLFDTDASPAQKAVQSLIQKGATEDRARDFAAATKTLELALKQLRDVAEMKGEEDSLLVRLGRAYIGGRHLDDAVRTFALLLGPGMEDCRRVSQPSSIVPTLNTTSAARICRRAASNRPSRF